MLFGRLLLFVMFGLFLAVVGAIVSLLVMRVFDGGIWNGLGTIGVAAATFAGLALYHYLRDRRAASSGKADQP